MDQWITLIQPAFVAELNFTSVKLNKFSGKKLFSSMVQEYFAIEFSSEFLDNYNHVLMIYNSMKKYF